MSLISKKMDDFINSKNDFDVSGDDVKIFEINILLGSLHHHQEIIDSYENSKAEIEIIKQKIKSIDPKGEIFKKILDENINELKEAKNFKINPDLIKKALKSYNTPIKIPNNGK